MVQYNSLSTKWNWQASMIIMCYNISILTQPCHTRLRRYIADWCIWAPLRTPGPEWSPRWDCCSRRLQPRPSRRSGKPLIQPQQYWVQHKFLTHHRHQIADSSVHINCQNKLLIDLHYPLPEQIVHLSLAYHSR